MLDTNLANSKSKAIQYVDQFVAANPGITPEKSAFPNVKINFINDFIGTLKKRINTPFSIRQGQSYLCGVASFCYCLVKEKPLVYAKLALDLYMNGKAELGGLLIDPNDNFRKTGYSKIASGLYAPIHSFDWVVMGSIKNSENSVFDYVNPSQAFSAATFPYELTSLINKAGGKATSEVWYHRNELSNVFSKDKQSILFQAEISRVEGLFKNLSRLSNIGRGGGEAIMFINSHMIDSSRATPSFPTHWIVLVSDVKLIWDEGRKTTSMSCFNVEKMSYSEILSKLKGRLLFKYFSWGEEKLVNISAEEFFKYYYGFISANFQSVGK